MSDLHTEKILDSIADGVFTVDLNWNITSFNRAAEKITGISRDQAIGQKCFDVFRADICQVRCALKKTIKTSKDCINLKINILNSKGETVPISISSSALYNDDESIAGGVETFRDLSSIEILRKEIHGKYSFEDIISKNCEMVKLFEIMPDIAMSDSTVLIEGPSGTGKELFAKALHNLSARKRKKYVAMNCGAFPDTLLESELFGYLKGAFTDAKKDKPGRFAMADNGTIFLDEIGDISTALQIKLLRVLQEHEIEPLGATRSIKVNARVIVATNKNLLELVARGVFREDLYYRLNVIKISLPPLLRRKEDIPLLIDHFIKNFNVRKNKEIKTISPDALEALMKYDFPGNIRELENIIEHAFILCHGDEIMLKHLPLELFSNNRIKDEKKIQISFFPLYKAEAGIIIDALNRNKGSRQKTASELGIHKATLWRKMKKYNINYPVHPHTSH